MFAMKKLLPIFFILIFTAKLKAQQSSLQAGPVLSFFGHNETGYGGELIANVSIQKILSAGAGIQVLKFEEEPSLYIPAFATFKLLLPAKKVVYFFHVDPGYGFHHNYSSGEEKSMNGDVKFEFKNTGGFYLGTGAGLHLKSKASPYINLQYSIYHLKNLIRTTEVNQSDVTTYMDNHNANSITITAGIWLHPHK